jgi:hypothetical protein
MRAALAVCLISALAACGYKPAPLTQQEEQTVSELTTNLKTRCVGRYLIDLPGDMLVSGYATIQDVNVETQEMSRDAYQRKITQRQAELKATKSIDAYPFLYASGDARGSDTWYFIYRGTVHDDPGRRFIEGYKWDHGYRIKLKIEAADFTNPDQTKDPIVKQMTVKNDVPEKTHLVFSLLAKVRGRAGDEIPSEPGLCFSGGFLSGNATGDQFVREWFSLTGKPDVFFEMATDTDPQGNTSLLQRGQETHTFIEKAGGRVLRKGSVDLSNMKADEWLVAGPTPAGLDGHMFSIEANATTSGINTPFLALDMINGGVNRDDRGIKIEKSSLTEGEAIELWDAVSRTLRPRPNGF